LDEEDNEPRLFWAAILTALGMQEPQRFTPLLLYLQPSNSAPLKYVLTALINLLVDSTQHFVLILDDYQVITEPQINTTLAHLVEHLPPQLRIILATRADPPLLLPQLRARRQVLEVRTDQLRCTVEEARTFFQKVIGTELPAETIQEVTTRTEGWLVGLYLLGLSLSEHANPLMLLEETSGDQRYILDYLTQEVLRRQPQEVQTFLLFTSILERFCASLCDAVMEQSGSQQVLERLEQTNLFMVSLDGRRQWYRYHALFAEALRYQLEQMYVDLVPVLHFRVSCWYAEHDQTTQAIIHAFHAQEWQWAADLVEHLPLMSFTWGAGEHELVLLRQWLEQLPAEVVHARPRLCLACSHMLWAVAPQTTLQTWLDTAEVTLTASLRAQVSTDASDAILVSGERQELENQLGEVIAFRAFLLSTLQDGQSVLTLCQRALALLSAQNSIIRAHVASAQLMAFYASSANDAVAAVQSGLQAGALAQEAGKTIQAISIMGTTVMHMIGTGRLHEALQLSQQAMQLGTKPEELMLPEVGWPAPLQADILREWNKLDDALSLAEESILLCKQTTSLASLVYSLCGYAVLLRIFLSRGELDAARSALQQLEYVGMNMNQLSSTHLCSFFTTIDQVRLWLACGELDYAIRWAKDLDVRGCHGSPFACEREEVARARILLATVLPDLALQRLEPVLVRATVAQRWDHVIEIRLLQTLAYQMRQEETLALSVLLEAVRLAEPEGYIRRFVEEGAAVAPLLSRLREEQHEAGLTPYLDTVLAAFPQQSEAHEAQPSLPRERTKAQPLLDPLSERELEVLRLLARGASNQEIAQELVIAIDTTKRHVSHVFSKLGVKNRLQAIRQARGLGLLDDER